MQLFLCLQAIVFLDITIAQLRATKLHIKNAKNN
jgi:hypothetical protein